MVGRVSKAKAICLFEAVKVIVDRLTRYRMEQSDQTAAGGHLVQVYGDLRRTKEQLQRSLITPKEEIELGFADADARLLSACCLLCFEECDRRLPAVTDRSERDWLVSRHRMLAEWTVELANDQLVELPLPKTSLAPPPGLREVLGRLHKKLGTPHGMPLGPLPKPAATVADLVGAVATQDPPPARPAVGPQDGVEAAAAPGVRADAWSPARNAANAEPLPAAAAAMAAEPAASAAGDTAVAVATDVEDQGEEGLRLVDPRRVRSPRVRALLNLEQRSLANAHKVRDYRMSLLHLAAVMEAVLIDHALTQGEQLRVVGTPDKWNMAELLVAALGPQCTLRDRATAGHVFAARDLTRPSIQMTSPMVVTAASFLNIHAFAVRVMQALGYQRTP